MPACPNVNVCKLREGRGLLQLLRGLWPIGQKIEGCPEIIICRLGALTYPSLAETRTDESSTVESRWLRVISNHPSPGEVHHILYITVLLPKDNSFSQNILQNRQPFISTGQDCLRLVHRLPLSVKVAVTYFALVTGL